MQFDWIDYVIYQLVMYDTRKEANKINMLLSQKPLKTSILMLTRLKLAIFSPHIKEIINIIS